MSATRWTDDDLRAVLARRVKPAAPAEVTFTLTMKLESTANKREHWAAKAKRAKAQRQAAKAMAEAVHAKAVMLPCIVSITRLGPRQLDTDNLATSGKSARDGIADALGIDDGSPLVTWQYDQAYSRTYSVSVRIQKRPA